MTHPSKTYELRIHFASNKDLSGSKTKQDVKDWLIGHGVEAFMEGAIDQLDIDHEYGLNERDYYLELGGDEAPISIFKYSLESLQDLKIKLEGAFKNLIRCEDLSMDTSIWMDGWKESFKPIKTERFYIYPPWEADKIPSDKIPLEIEPGMAFGTGQHATTQACLFMIEKLDRLNAVKAKDVVDVGTGTGILSLAVHKLGSRSILGTDIDPDAIIAARQNAELNQVSLNLKKESVPQGEGLFDLVIANILMVVLEKITKDLARVCRAGGNVIVSGLLVEDSEKMKKLGASLGLKFKDQINLEGWAAILFEKNP